MPNNSPPRFRPKPYPAPEFPARRAALFSRMPPAVFPVILGLLGLGLAARRACAAFGVTGNAVELVLGAVTALWAFAALGYGIKMVRRPGVLRDDLKVLPGRAGLAALSMGMMLVAAVLVPYAPGLAKAVLFAGVGLHAVLAVLVVTLAFAAPKEQREVTPVWHLQFVGFIVGAVAAVPLGLVDLAMWLLWGTIPVAVAIWGISGGQLIRRVPPAPLRPLLAIHLAPASLFATVAASLGMTALGLGFLGLGMGIVLALVVAQSWVTHSGFSPMWGAFTFPVAAYASAMFANGLDATGGIVLLVALGIVPMVAFRVLKLWASGDLAAKTNAAAA